MVLHCAISKIISPRCFLFILRFVKDKVYCAKLQKIMNLKEAVENAFQEINYDKLLQREGMFESPLLPATTNAEKIQK